VVEDVKIKKEIFKKISLGCRKDAIIATNTSTFIPSMFLDSIKYTERFAALHFHSYVWNSSVVDIMPHKDTSEETIKTLENFSKKIGQIPIILKKESHNYVFNAIWNEVSKAAIDLVVNGITTVQEVDLAWTEILKMPIGPFGIMDHAGLDTALNITNYWAEKLNDEQLKRNAQFLKSYVDEGKLGVKTGKGFYNYLNDEI
jgi:3-hydroxybutyryl-CoA dehydrogenase